MNEFSLLAEPWCVNLLIFIPFLAYALWRSKGLAISNGTLAAVGCFGIAFGFVEAAVVIYLRAAVGLLPGYGGTLADVATFSSRMYQNEQLLHELPENLLAVEIAREAATMVMLLGVAYLAAKSWRERCALFLWSFAAWDIFFYVGLWLTVGWPPSLLAPDVLFLIPVPWVSQVWFPVLVSALSMIAVVLAKRLGERRP